MKNGVEEIKERKGKTVNEESNGRKNEGISKGRSKQQEKNERRLKINGKKLSKIFKRNDELSFEEK